MQLCKIELENLFHIFMTHLIIHKMMALKLDVLQANGWLYMIETKGINSTSKFWGKQLRMNKRVLYIAIETGPLLGILSQW